jgi:hypothetical protein
MVAAMYMLRIVGIGAFWYLIEMDYMFANGHQLSYHRMISIPLV